MNNVWIMSVVFPYCLNYIVLVCLFAKQDSSNKPRNVVIDKIVKFKNSDKSLIFKSVVQNYTSFSHNSDSDKIYIIWI